mgnify:CR=1 FL=1
MKVKLMNELKIQRQLIEAIQALGGYAYKASHRFMGGVADLDITLPDYRHWKWEIKYLPQVPSKGKVTVRLSPLQEQFIRDIHKAGGCAGWVCVVRDPANKEGINYWILMGVTERGPHTFDLNDRHQINVIWKNRGQPWPIPYIMSYMESAHAVQRKRYRRI